jgi:hypothetical protein
VGAGGGAVTMAWSETNITADGRGERGAEEKPGAAVRDAQI